MDILDPDGTPPVTNADREPVDVSAADAYWSLGTKASGTSRVYVSGQVGLDENGELVGDDPYEQTKKTLENFDKVLSEAGATSDDVTKVTAYVTDMDNAGEVAKARTEYFDGHTPASSIVEVSGLYFEGLLVEIEGIAEIDG